MKNQFKILTALLFIFSLITSCSKDTTAVEEEIVLESNYPVWLTVENDNLGQVIVSQISNNGDGKEDYQFEISGINDHINWEFYQNQNLIEDKDNWQGNLNAFGAANETIKIVFVDEPLVYNLGETNITYRYSMNWDTEAYDEAYILRTHSSAIDIISNSNVPELADILQNGTIKLINNIEVPTLGSASTQGIVMNIYRSSVSELYYATVWIHEAAHMYQDLHQDLVDKMQEFFDNATWHEPGGYYATNRNELFACAFTAYITNNTDSGGAHHFVQREAYYQDIILPYLRELFE